MKVKLAILIKSAVINYKNDSDKINNFLNIISYSRFSLCEIFFWNKCITSLIVFKVCAFDKVKWNYILNIPGGKSREEVKEGLELIYPTLLAYRKLWNMWKYEYICIFILCICVHTDCFFIFVHTVHKNPIIITIIWFIIFIYTVHMTQIQIYCSQFFTNFTYCYVIRYFFLFILQVRIVWN